MSETFPYADRTYRRHIGLRPAPGVIEVEMEDYCHHFRLRVQHHEGVVDGVESEGVRVPWDTCVTGANGARSLIGTSLAAAVEAATWAPDRSAQCVHVVDLVLLAVRHALDSDDTTYEAIVAPGSHRRRQATLDRDGRREITWDLDGDRVTGPERFAGLALERVPFFAWIRERLDERGQEDAVVLRRACYIGVSRGLELDAYAYAGNVHDADNSCYTYRPNVALTSRRVTGSSRATEDDLDLA